jgi:hypothetical protein
VIVRLSGQLARSAYWSTRFEAFGMSADDLVSGVFPNERVPRIMFEARRPEPGAQAQAG